MTEKQTDFFHRLAEELRGQEQRLDAYLLDSGEAHPDAHAAKASLSQLRAKVEQAREKPQTQEHMNLFHELAAELETLKDKISIWIHKH